LEKYKEIVVDASVVVKWFAVERGFEKALKLRDTHLRGLARLVAPNLILY
jgi:predicted nucleic acid-binding protein